MTKGVLVRRHQRHKLSEMIKLSSSNGCRDIEWAKPLPEDLLLSKVHSQNGRNHNESSNNLLNGLQNHQNHNNYVTRDGQTIEIYKQQPGSSSARTGAAAGPVGNANDLSIFHCFIASKSPNVVYQFVCFLTHFSRCFAVLLLSSDISIISNSSDSPSNGQFGDSNSLKFL
jgi:hypothetical protein